MLLSLSLENREDNVGVLLLGICELREALPVFFFHCFSGHFAASVCICVGMRQDVFKLYLLRSCCLPGATLSILHTLACFMPTAPRGRRYSCQFSSKETEVQSRLRNLLEVKPCGTAELGSEATSPR